MKVLENAITDQDLWNIKITKSPNIELLAEQILGRDLRGFSYPVAVLKNPAPYFIYTEDIQVSESEYVKRYEADIFKHYSSDFGSGSIGFSVERDLLHFGSKYFDDNVKGTILLRFCELEFVLDIIVLHKIGIYQDDCTYKEVKEHLIKEYSGVFSSFENKKNYLKALRIINSEHHEVLTLCQRVRNQIAHNFFLENNIGLPAKVLDTYPDILSAIKYIYNYAWLLTIKKYNEIQEDVLSWVVKNKQSMN